MVANVQRRRIRASKARSPRPKRKAQLLLALPGEAGPTVGELGPVVAFMRIEGGKVALKKRGRSKISWATHVALAAGSLTNLERGGRGTVKLRPSLDFLEGLGCKRHGSTQVSGLKVGEKVRVKDTPVKELVEPLLARPILEDGAVRGDADATVIRVVSDAADGAITYEVLSVGYYDWL